MTATARARNLWGETTPLEVSQDENAYIVTVPVLGALVVGRGTTGLCELVQPDSDNCYSAKSHLIRREVAEVDGHLEIELLPNSSGEDRLVVEIYP